LGKADFKSVSGTLLTSVRAEKDTQGLNWCGLKILTLYQLNNFTAVTFLNGSASHNLIEYLTAHQIIDCRKFVCVCKM
jgi:hypothetical protein